MNQPWDESPTSGLGFVFSDIIGGVLSPISNAIVGIKNADAAEEAAKQALKAEKLRQQSLQKMSGYLWSGAVIIGAVILGVVALKIVGGKKEHNDVKQ